VRSNGQVLESLKRKISALVNRSDQKVTFTVTANSTDGEVTLVSEKSKSDSPEIQLTEIEHGKRRPLTYESFRQKYDLIYDIPENPTERIRQSVDDIREEQALCLSRVTQFKNVLLRTVDSARNSRNPQRIAQLDKEAGDLRGAVSQADDTIAAHRARLELVEKYLYGRLLSDIGSRLSARTRQYEELIKERGKAQRQARKLDNSVRIQINVTEQSLQAIRDLHASIIAQIRPVLPRKDSTYLSVWEKTDFGKIWISGAFPVAFLRDAKRFQESLEKRLEGMDSHKLEEGKLYRELINLLEPYRSRDVEIPGLSLSLTQFLSALTRKAQTYAASESSADKLRDASESLGRLISVAESLEASLKKVRELRKYAKDEIEELGRSAATPELLRALDQELSNLRSQREEMQIRCGRLGITEANLAAEIEKLERDEGLRDFRDASVSDLESSAGEIAGLLRAAERDVTQGSARLAYLDADLKRLKEQKAHKYQDRLPDLNKLLDVCNQVESRLQRQFASALKAISSLPAEPPRDEFDQRYYEAVGRFLAEKLGKIRHGDRFYGVSKVDLQDGVILADSGKHIRLEDMGTGQSQAAYLQTILSRHDGRRVIALIDEVAMMDQASLGPVIAKLQDLEKSQKLLFGLVVQKGESPSASRLS
jgi:exonuclease SbcC